MYLLNSAYFSLDIIDIHAWMIMKTRHCEETYKRLLLNVYSQWCLKKNDGYFQEVINCECNPEMVSWFLAGS